MKISTKGRYAVRMLLDIAKHSAGGCVPLKDVAERQDISKKYLEQIVPVLIRSGVLLTVRGARGGYILSGSPKDYTVGYILKLTEGSLAPVSCLDQKENHCSKRFNCPTLFVWEGLEKVVSDYLGGITLQDILDKEAKAYSNDYII